jgi:hypothetical protein
VAGGVAPREDEQHWGDEPSQLLGHATDVQGSDPIGAGPFVSPDTVAEDWCLLLHVAPGPHFQLGDGGDLAILIRSQDLAAGRYDRLATSVAMG